MRRVKVAIPTRSRAGLDDIVSEVFGKAETFTIVEVELGKIVSVHVINNPAASYKYGSRPIVAKTLVDLNVDVILAAEIGPGASELLSHHNIKVIPVEPNMKIADAIKENLSKIEQTT